MFPKTSIIIPVYNTEKYLRQCIESVLNQSVTDFELLLIDDGSKDGSAAICDAFAEKDARVKVFHRTNGGVSAARNFGIEQAQGKFLTFIDSDDWVECKYLEHLLAGGEGAELYAVGYSEQSEKLVWNEYLPEKEIFEYEQIKDFYEKHIASCIGHSPWGKLFLREIIEKHRLCFDTAFAYVEDTLFCLRYLKKINKISVNNSVDYYWRYVPASLSHINPVSDIVKWNAFITAYKSEFLPVIEKYGASEILKCHLASRYFNVFSKTAESICNAKINSVLRRQMLRTACEQLDEYNSCYYIDIARSYGVSGKILLKMYESRQVRFYELALKIIYFLKNTK